MVSHFRLNLWRYNQIQTKNLWSRSFHYHNIALVLFHAAFFFMFQSSVCSTKQNKNCLTNKHWSGRSSYASLKVTSMKNVRCIKNHFLELNSCMSKRMLLSVNKFYSTWNKMQGLKLYPHLSKITQFDWTLLASAATTPFDEPTTIFILTLICERRIVKREKSSTQDGGMWEPRAEKENNCINLVWVIKIMELKHHLGAHICNIILLIWTGS